jgi:hypothetical protein
MVNTTTQLDNNFALSIIPNEEIPSLPYDSFSTNSRIRDIFLSSVICATALNCTLVIGSNIVYLATGEKAASLAALGGVALQVILCVVTLGEWAIHSIYNKLNSRNC